MTSDKTNADNTRADNAHAENTSAPDPRPIFADAVATARSVIAAVTPDDLQQSTHCPDFDVEHLLGHMLIVVRRTTALGDGTNPFAMPDAVTGVAADGWLDAFDAEVAASNAAWRDDAVLDRMMTLPWAEAPGRQMLLTYVPELTVHTWDLARAIGASVDWTESTLNAALGTATMLLPPAPRGEFKLPNGMPAPFDDPIEVDASAPTIDQLVGWYGRQPA